MPCCCFGSKKQKEDLSLDNEAFSYPDQKSSLPDVSKYDHTSSKRLDECPTSFSYNPRNESFVDSPRSNRNHAQPLPMVTVVPSSASPDRSALPFDFYKNDSRRSDLAEMRKDFFKELYDDQLQHRKTYPIECLETTDISPISTIDRAQNFGQVRRMSPVPQQRPSNDETQAPTNIRPPGPHLLHACSPKRSSVTLKCRTEEPSLGFSSPAFLQELKLLTAGLSERWAIAEEERQRKIASEITSSATDLPNMSQVFHVEEELDLLQPSTSALSHSSPESQMASHCLLDQTDVPRCSNATSFLKGISDNSNSTVPGCGTVRQDSPSDCKVRKYIEDGISPPLKTEDEILNELSEMEVRALFKKGSIDIFEMPEIVIDPSPDCEFDEGIISAENFEIDLRSLSTQHVYTFDFHPHVNDSPPQEPVDLLKMMEKMSSEEEEDITDGDEVGAHPAAKFVAPI